PTVAQLNQMLHGVGNACAAVDQHAENIVDVAVDQHQRHATGIAADLFIGEARTDKYHAIHLIGESLQQLILALGFLVGIAEENTEIEILGATLGGTDQ